MPAVAKQAIDTYAEAAGYLKTLERSLVRKSKFNNDLLYNMVAMTFEKLFVSLLASNRKQALHHTPFALYKEASQIVEMPEEFKNTAKLLMQFESICSFDAFGYKTPNEEQLHEMITGLMSIRDFVYEHQHTSMAG